MKQELEMMEYIVDKHNDLLGGTHANNRFGEFDDRQIDRSWYTSTSIYDELNVKFFGGEL